MEALPIGNQREAAGQMLSIPELGAAIDEHAAIRRIRRMQPAGGVGDKLFPPTYPAEREGPQRHVFERRRLDDREVWCVLIDSVQSQANRMEEALLAAAAEEAIPLPYVTVDFREAGLQPLEQITSLDAPHRVYDAIIRDSLLDDVPFMESEQGRRLAAATPASATALLEISPSALLFGAWHSQGEGGGLGAKFPRALVSEIIGVDTPVGRALVHLDLAQYAKRIDAATRAVRGTPGSYLRVRRAPRRADAGGTPEASGATCRRGPAGRARRWAGLRWCLHLHLADLAGSDQPRSDPRPARPPEPERSSDPRRPRRRRSPAHQPHFVRQVHELHARRVCFAFPWDEAGPTPLNGGTIVHSTDGITWTAPALKV